MINSPNSNICNLEENYEQLFITCPKTTFLWNEIQRIFTLYGLTHNLRQLKYIVIGYKPYHTD